MLILCENVSKRVYLAVRKLVHVLWSPTLSVLLSESLLTKLLSFLPYLLFRCSLLHRVLQLFINGRVACLNTLVSHKRFRSRLLRDLSDALLGVRRC